MNVIAVDDEQLLLEDMVDLLRNIQQIDHVEGFNDADSAIDYFKNNPVDVAFLDIRMRGMEGMELAKCLQQIKENINIIFMTGYEEYALEAFKQHASGYLMKPPMEEEIIEELEKLRNDVCVGSDIHNKQIYVHTFGNFEIQINGQNVDFSNKRAKEALAYLISRKGESVTRKELAAVLYEERLYDRNLQKLMQTVLSDLKKVLVKYDIENMLIKGSNSYYIDTEMFECDYYKFLKGDQEARQEYVGEYLVNYSWAEETNGLLMSIKYDEI